MTQVGLIADGKQIVEQIDAMQSFAFPQSKQLTVITLATPEAVRTSEQSIVAAAVEELPPLGEVLPSLATSPPTTAPSGAGGGGTPCGASCN